jgi:hypothetical protein
MPRHWVAVVPPERFAVERAYAHDALELDVSGDAGDLVALVAATEPPVLFGLGVAASDGVRYTRRLFDDAPTVQASYPPGLTEISADSYGALASLRGTDRDRAAWFVSVALPIEAPSPAEAVREFWTYVDKLGPSELPAFVWPRGDELAMQAYLLGEAVNLDPEEE